MQAPGKVCNEKEKMTAVQKNFRERKDFIRLYQKICWANFDKLWILNEGTPL